MRKSFLISFSLWFCFFGMLIGCSAQGIADAPTATIAPTRRPRVIEVSATPSSTPTVLPTATRTTTPQPSATAFITPPASGDAAVIPILMYHHLNTLAPNASETLRTWTVSPENFSAQLDYLQQRGFHTITLKQFVDFFSSRAPLPTKPIVLTFDDAWIDDYTVAFPELQKRNMVGVFFVPTNYVDAGGKQLLNWTQVLEMDRAGMEIGGHTINHEDLTKTNLVEVRRQLVEGKARIEDKLGHPIVALSYPFGAFNPRVVAETNAAGYQAAVILCCGYKQKSDAMLMLPRIRISYGDTLDAMAKRLP